MICNIVAHVTAFSFYFWFISWKHFIHEHTSNTCATFLNYITWEQIASSCSCSRKKLQKHLQLQLNAQRDEKSNWFNTRLPCNQGGSTRTQRGQQQLYLRERWLDWPWERDWDAMWPLVICRSLTEILQGRGQTGVSCCYCSVASSFERWSSVQLEFMSVILRTGCSLSVVGGSCSPVGYYEPILVAVAFKGSM